MCAKSPKTLEIVFELILQTLPIKSISFNQSNESKSLQHSSKSSLLHLINQRKSKQLLQFQFEQKNKKDISCN